jgi:hypothetical protein
MAEELKIILEPIESTPEIEVQTEKRKKHKQKLIFQEPGINTLLTMNPKRAETIDTSQNTGSNTAIVTSPRNAGYIELSNYEAGSMVLNDAVFDTLVILLDKLTNEGMKTNNLGEKYLHLTVNEYMLITNTRDRKEAKKRLEKAITFLTATMVPDYNPKKNTTEKGEIVKNLIPISDYASFYKNGDVDFYFKPAYIEKLIETNFRMYFTWSVLRKRSNSFQYTRTLGYYISLMKRENVGTTREDIIKLQTLLERGGLPTYEKTKASGRHFEEEIIKPFEKNMDAIEEFTWHYCDSKGRAWKEEFLPITAKNFFRSDMYIKITWKDYPDSRKKLIEEKEKQKKIAAKKKGKTIEKRG